MSDAERCLRLKAELDEARRQEARKEGEQARLLAQLAEEFGTDDLAAAQAELDRLDAERAKLERLRAKRLREFEAEFGERLGG